MSGVRIGPVPHIYRTSALPPKAEFDALSRHVAKVPEAVISLHRVCWSEGAVSTEPSLNGVTYDFEPRLVIAANSATRLPRARAASNSISSTPGESGPVVALAPNAPPPLTTLI